MGTGAAGTASQGLSVALSGDGNTAIVGGNLDAANAGAAWVYTRSGGVWSQQGAKLVGTGAVGAAHQGTSVALSADGNTAIVGGTGDNGSAGASWVYVRSGGVWNQQGAKLVGTGAVGAANQGSSVAVSGDGNTAIVGGIGDNGNAGAAWVYSRSGGAWSQIGAKLVGTGAVGIANQGYSVAMSGDGNTAIVGGYTDNNPVGAAWVFVNPAPKIVSIADVPNDQGGKVHVLWNASVTDAAPSYGISSYTLWRQITTAAAAQAAERSVPLRSGGASSATALDDSRRGAIRVTTEGTQSVYWEFVASVPARGASGYGYMAPTTSDSLPGPISSQQGAKLVGTGGSSAQQGNSVAISADGNTAIAGGPFDNGAAGAAWVYTRSGRMWSQQGAKLVGTGAVGAANQGYSVAMSADGNTVVVGADADNSNAGAAWVYTRSGGVWSQQGAKLVGTGAVGAANQGYSVAVSGDGNTAIVGGWQDNSTGAAWVYTRSGGVWSQQGAKLVGTGAVGTAAQGTSVALSADGNTAVVGGFFDNSTVGAAWVYTRSGGVWSQQGAKLVGSDAVGGAQQGWSVAVSARGDTAIVGGQFDNGGVGAAWVYTRSAGVWNQRGAKLVGTAAAGFANQGYSVAVSGDGNTAIVGGPGDNGSAGATWVYTPNPSWNVFFVDAKDATTSAFYVSPSDSGYSVDNLPPGTPAGVTAAFTAGTTYLHWSVNAEADFAAYRIYRGNSAGFVPGPTNLVAMKPDTGYADVGSAGGYYKISAVDVHGNESGFALVSPSNTAGVSGDGQLSFALEGVYPNPALGRDLAVRFVLPVRAEARLELFDVAGRSVVVREVGALGAGAHTANLAEHARIRPGLYFVRLRQGTNQQVKRVTVLE